jgi:RHS repeat-associated protein
VQSNNQALQPHRYTSYERDSNGGDEAMFRRYEGRWQRFAQPDPYEGSYVLTDPQSFNRYAYVQNDPVNFIDPMGLCTFNINISGASGQLLTDIQNELTRIFASGGHNVVFNTPEQANGGSMNLNIVSQFTGDAANFIRQQGISPSNIGIPGVTPTGGNNAYVNQTHVSVTTLSFSTYRASLGTMIGRVGAHEVIQHGFLRNPLEGVSILSDVTYSPRSVQELSSMHPGQIFNIGVSTAADLSRLCPPQGRGIGSGNRGSSLTAFHYSWPDEGGVGGGSGRGITGWSGYSEVINWRIKPPTVKQ